MAKRFARLPEPRYFLVGAYWGRDDDKTDVFLHRGYWELGWSDRDKPDMAEKRDEMRKGDRIARRP
jgi:hypothetical protein